jgi:hypothetical protein
MEFTKEVAANKIRSAWLNFTNKYSRCVECLFVRDRNHMTGNMCIYCSEDCHDFDTNELWCGCIDVCRGRCGFKQQNDNWY